MFGTYPKCSPDNYVNIIQYLPTPCISLSLALRFSFLYVRRRRRRCMCLLRPNALLNHSSTYSCRSEQSTNRNLFYLHEAIRCATKVGACHSSSMPIPFHNKRTASIKKGINRSDSSCCWNHCPVPSRLVLNYVVVLQVLLVGNENVQVKNAFENCKITTHTTYSHR